jgi:integrase
MTTEFEIKNAKPKDKEYSISVADGLFLLVKPTGNKLWRYRYSFGGKRYLLSLGKYPTTTIKLAKARHREYLDLIDKGINPSTYKHIEKTKIFKAKTFKEVALEWFNKKYQSTSIKQRMMIESRMKNYLFPILGRLPIKQIEAPMLFNIIENIQASGKIETGNRTNTLASVIFRYGVAKGYCKRDITADYKGMLKTSKVQHMPTLTKEQDIAQLLRDIDNYNGSLQTKYALQIISYIFVRASELVNSKWEYIDFEKNEWVIPAEFMKMKRDHLIPIPKQVRDILLKLYPITGHSEYIFIGRDDTKPMNPETMNKAIRRIDNGKYIGKMVTHGFRSMASTVLNEHKFRSDVIEKQLAHQERNKIRGAYNRAEYLSDRVEMIQWYADYLDSLNK